MFQAAVNSINSRSASIEFLMVQSEVRGSKFIIRTFDNKLKAEVTLPIYKNTTVCLLIISV